MATREQELGEAARRLIDGANRAASLQLDHEDVKRSPREYDEDAVWKVAQESRIALSAAHELLDKYIASVIELTREGS